MISICQYNRLKVAKNTKHGYFLENREGDNVLLPHKFAAKDYEAGESVRVFTYIDSQNRLVSTTQNPKILLYEFAILRCVDIAPFGAFMDWGLERDLLIPNGEQETAIQPGEYHICYLYLDDQDRPTGTTRVSRVLDRNDIELEVNEEVDLVIWEETKLGYKVIINHIYEGLIYHNEIFKNVFVGKPMKGYVKKIREDKRIDISLEQIGYKNAIDGNRQMILTALHDNGGKLPLHDKSTSEDIKETLRMSKKAFKKTIGALYKEKKIIISDKGIQLT